MDKAEKHFDFVVVGGGIVGITTAFELQIRHPSALIALLEKESALAAHQTGHNSGVIHAGVYYSPGSLKARFCREGKMAIRAFCDEYKIPYKICGKLIVATDQDELARMAALKSRSAQNDIPIEEVSVDELRKLEPHISGVGALLSPSTGIVNFAQVAQVMAKLFADRGGVIEYDCTVRSGRESKTTVTLISSKGTFECAYAVICAGLHSDRMISAFGHTPDYRVVPFRGEYFRLKNQPSNLVNHLIYPVPDPERPFLGVHLTQKLGGGFTVGPNAVLAMKREGYKRAHISAGDLLQTFSYPGFWRMLSKNSKSAAAELTTSLSKRLYLNRVRKYCAHIQLDDLAPYAAGVRAQAVANDGHIIDDFLFVKTRRCLHVGNAPSPAATSSIPISKYIANQLCQDSPEIVGDH